jgi:flagellar hook-length control protein FliK
VDVSASLLNRDAGGSSKPVKAAGSAAHLTDAAATGIRNESNPGGAALSGIAPASGGHVHAVAGAGSEEETQEHAQTLSSSPALSSNPYDRLDQQTADASGAARVLHAGPQSVSVGVRDPGLGWVEIHTQSAAGQVSAVMATDSTAAHTSLAAHLPSLSRFLSDHDVTVGRLAVEHGLSQNGGGSGAGQGNSQGTYSGSGSGGDAASSGASQPVQQAADGIREARETADTAGMAVSANTLDTFMGGGAHVSSISVIA